MINTILAMIIALSINITTYADTDIQLPVTDLQKVQQSILEDADFIGYLYNMGISESDIKEVLESEYFARYVEFEFLEMPEHDDIMASCSIIDWHVKKLENFINYLFMGDKEYKVNYNNYNNPNNGYNNNYNNMMPPPPPMPPYWNNGQYQPGQYNNWSGGYGRGNGSGMCSCECENCRNCLCK